MKSITRTQGILLLTALGALGVAALRLWQIVWCMDGEGLLLQGSHSGQVLIFWLVLVALGLGILIWNSNRVKGDGACITGSTPAGLLQLVGGLLLGGASLLLVNSFSPVWGDPVCLAGVLSGLLVAVGGLLTVMGKNPPMVLYMLPGLALTGLLLLNFQAWNLAPNIFNSGMELLVLSCGTLAVFTFGGFGLKQGLVRSGLWFSAMTVVCSGTMAAERLALLVRPSLPRDCYMSGTHLLLTAGFLLWSLGAVVLLLRGEVQNREPPPEEKTDEGDADGEDADGEDADGEDADGEDAGETPAEETERED